MVVLLSLLLLVIGGCLILYLVSSLLVALNKLCVVLFPWWLVQGHHDQITPINNWTMNVVVMVMCHRPIIENNVSVINYLVITFSGWSLLLGVLVCLSRFVPSVLERLSERIVSKNALRILRKSSALRSQLAKLPRKHMTWI